MFDNPKLPPFPFGPRGSHRPSSLDELEAKLDPVSQMIVGLFNKMADNEKQAKATAESALKNLVLTLKAFELFLEAYRLGLPEEQLPKPVKKMIEMLPDLHYKLRDAFGRYDPTKQPDDEVFPQKCLDCPNFAGGNCPVIAMFREMGLPFDQLP